MTPTLIPAPLLAKAERILFIAHLALGDFTYLQNCFQALAAAYPHLKIDLWVDEVRRTSDPAQWPHLQKYALYDWVEQCGCFDRIYRTTYSPALYQTTLQEAQAVHYPIVITLATLRPPRYAMLARSICPDGLVIGMQDRVRWYQPQHRAAYRRLDGALLPYSGGPRHISDVYADWFTQLCGLDLPGAARFPFVAIPEQWRSAAQQRLADWGWRPRSGKLVFVNPFAKTHKRCWPLEHVAALIKAMQQQDAWRDACFIVNAVPQELARARSVLQRYDLARTELFSAEENFFQLPAMLAECDLIISVETAVMHLANAVQVPVVALMRQKNPEWVPLDSANSSVITAARRRDWVKAISVEQVMKAIA